MQLDTILVLTASDSKQADLYRAQLADRQAIRHMAGVRRWHVIPDPAGERIGSGGSTLEVLKFLATDVLEHDGPKDSLEDVFRSVRCLILHAGGDSKRLPAYAPCGKSFVPMPPPPTCVLPPTLIDLQLEDYLALPTRKDGQVLVASGDVLVRFDPAEVDFERPGLTGVGCPGPVHEAVGHGVYARLDADGAVASFLQKPTADELDALGVLDADARVPVDTGIMSFGPAFAAALLRVFGWDVDGEQLVRASDALDEGPFDLYTEIACALPMAAGFDAYRETVDRWGASYFDAGDLRAFFDAFHGTPFHCCVPSACDFLHFGSSRDYISSSYEIHRRRSPGSAQDAHKPFVFDSMGNAAGCTGRRAVVEGCRLDGPLALGGDNLVVGVHVPPDGLELPPGVCLDVLPATLTDGADGYVHRLYDVSDTFKTPVAEGGTFLGAPMLHWLEDHGIAPSDVWPAEIGEADRSLWNARMFVGRSCAAPCALMMWMIDESPSPSLVRKWIAAPRYAVSDMGAAFRPGAFWEARRQSACAALIPRLPASLDHPAELGPAELARLLERSADAVALERRLEDDARSSTDRPRGARVLHTLGSALALREAPAERVAQLKADAMTLVREVIRETLPSCERAPRAGVPVGVEIRAAAPLRLDLAGGWTDTPPYALEHGGVVVNVAVQISGRKPIEVRARLTEERCIRIVSRDADQTTLVRSLDELADHESPIGVFSIPKTALAMCGLSPQFWPRDDGATLDDILGEFGGGIELTLHSDAPKGSGLGASSILSAAVLGALAGLRGEPADHARIFQEVLALEQFLTTGGGWQDQLGGVLPGLKRVECPPGLTIEPAVQSLPADCLLPDSGRVLFYYTGIARLAKNILQEIVGAYMDRDPETVRTLGLIRANAEYVREALIAGDYEMLADGIDRSWRLNKRLDPGSTTPEIDTMLDRLAPHLLGAKLLGAGGGGFLLMLCKDAHHAAEARNVVRTDESRSGAGFAEFAICSEGLTVERV